MSNRKEFSTCFDLNTIRDKIEMPKGSLILKAALFFVQRKSIIKYRLVEVPKGQSLFALFFYFLFVIFTTNSIQQIHMDKLFEY